MKRCMWDFYRDHRAAGDSPFRAFLSAIPNGIALIIAIIMFLVGRILADWLGVGEL